MGERGSDGGGERGGGLDFYVAALGGRDGASDGNDPSGLAVEPTTLMLAEQEASAGSGTYTALFTAVSVTVLVVAFAAKRQTLGDQPVAVGP